MSLGRSRPQDEAQHAPRRDTSSRPPGRRLRGSDAGFLYVETETQTSTCVDVVVLEPPVGDASPLGPDELRRHVAGRLDRVPHLRRRLHQVPGGIGHAVWADDPGFDLAAHVTHAHLATGHRAAGGPNEQLHAWLADVSATRLPLDRPLWHVTLVDGFADGSQALVFRFHHTLGDGAALLGILEQLCDDRVVGAPPVVPAADRRRQRAPWPVWLFVSTLVRQVFVWLTLPALVAHSVGRVRAVRARRAAAEVRVPRMSGDAPDTVLNRSADNRRAYGRAVLALDDLKRLKAVTGAPLSDVVVAVVAGALRTHLLERQALPGVPLVVNVPVGNDLPASGTRVRGNVFVNYYAELRTEVADPRARLAATSASAAEARLQLEVQGRDTLTRWLDRVPPAIAWRLAQRMAADHREGRVPPDYNVLVSNVRVPTRDWRLGGRPVRTVFMSGPVADGFGLNVTVTGYGDEVTVTLHANPESVPDPSALARDVAGALTLLVRAHTDPGCTGPVVQLAGRAFGRDAGPTNTEVA